METALYIAVLVVAVAFAAGVGFLGKILVNLTKTLSNVADMIEQVKQPVFDIATEGVEIAHKTNKLAQDFNEKASRLNPIVDEYKGVGDKINEFNNTLTTSSRQFTAGLEKNKDEIGQLLNFGLATYLLYKKVDREEDAYK